MPGRFDTFFYLVEAPRAQRAEVWPGELTAGEWIAPADRAEALGRGHGAAAPVRCATRWRCWAPSTTRRRCARGWRRRPTCADFVAQRLEFQRGVRIVPVRTPTLPPATHTNAYLLGTRRAAGGRPGGRRRGRAGAVALAGPRAPGRGLPAEGDRRSPTTTSTTWVASRSPPSACGLPVWAHAKTADRLPVKVERLLNDGDVLELDGPMPMRWRVLHTPGHARGHVCLVRRGVESGGGGRHGGRRGHHRHRPARGRHGRLPGAARAAQAAARHHALPLARAGDCRRPRQAGGVPGPPPLARREGARPRWPPSGGPR